MEGEEGSSGKERGLRRVFGSGIGGDLLNEAFVEHFTDSLLNGHFDQTSSTSQERVNSDAYQPARDLQHVLTHEGLKPVDIRLFSAACFEDPADDGSDSFIAGEQLVTALQEAFPFTDVVEEIKALEISSNEDPDRVLNKYGLGLVMRSLEYKIAQYKAEATS